MDFCFLGKNNGVITKLKNKNPFMTATHCIAHRFAFVGKDSAKNVPYFREYESTLKRLYGYFSRSYNRLKNLRIIQADDDDDPRLAILKLISTRWLSLSQTVSNLHQTLNSIITSLQTDIIVDEDGAELAEKLLEELDPKFILATKFLADLFSILQRLIKAFQGDFITLSDVHYHLNSTILAIQTTFIGDDDTPPTYGRHLLEYIENNQLSLNIKFDSKFLFGIFPINNSKY